MLLTALAVKSAKPRSRPYKMCDYLGLYLLVTPKGQKYWRLNYRWMSQQKTLALGVFPQITLSEARKRRDAAKRLLADGVDPSEERKLKTLAAQLAAANTFKAVAEEWVAKAQKEGRADITVHKLRWLLGLAYPSIGRRPISRITTPELLAVIRKVEGRGHHETAQRLRSVCSRVFRYAIITSRAERDIAADLRGALTTPKVTHRAAITTVGEAGELLRAIDGYSGHFMTRIALRLAPHVFVRPGELRMAQWSELDREKAIWTIPAEKMKMRVPHRVPLSRQVVAILAEIEPITGDGRYVFPSHWSPMRPMCENTLNTALRRMSYAQDEMTSHGFRAMAATLLNEMGKWNPDAIERQLAHAEANGVRRAYARGEFWSERVAMMQEWSDYLDMLRDRARILQPKFGVRCD